MGIFSKSTTNDSFAIDIGASSVKVLKLSKQGSSWKIIGVASSPITRAIMADKTIVDNNAMANAITSAIKKAGIKSNNAFVSMPAAQTTSKIITMPQGLDLLEQENFIELEAENHLPFPTEDVRMDFQIIGPSKDEDNLEVLLVASKNEHYQERVDAVTSADLNVEVMDVDNFAMERAMRYIIDLNPLQVEDPIEVVIDMGHEFTIINVLQEGRTIYNREQHFGVKQLVDEVGRRFGMSQEEVVEAMVQDKLPDDYALEILPQFRAELSNQVNRLIQFFFAATSYNRVHRIWLSGGGASLEGLVKEITDLTGVETKIANPFEYLSYGKSNDSNVNSIRKIGPSYLTAFGLAIWQKENSINLMPWREVRRKEYQKDFMSKLGLAALVGLGVVIISAMFLSSTISGQKSRNKYIQDATEQAQNDIKEIEELEAKRDGLLGRKDVIERLQSSRDQIAYVFYELAANTVDGVTLNSMENKGSKLEIRGVATSNSAVASYMKNLEKSQWFDKPEVVIIENASLNAKSSNQAVNTNNYNFTVTLNLINPNAPIEDEELSSKKNRDRKIKSKSK